MIRIAVLGATGRMGQALVRLIDGVADLKLVGAGTEPGHADIGQDAGSLAGVTATGVTVTDDVATAVASAQVVIDFTLPDALRAHLAACTTSGSAMVIGTTGFSGEHHQAIADASRNIAIVYGRNMSVGVNVLTALVRRAGETLDADFDVEITEAHHRDKIDAPSGTALQLGEAVAAARGTSLESVGVYGRSGQTGARDRGSIGFHSLRAGRIAGDHSVLFAADEEEIEFAHRARDRAVFARGALRAARWVTDQPPGLYGMAEVLGLT
jgi:4-hydroxy-tetrahydrodipicolinate reductase